MTDDPVGEPVSAADLERLAGRDAPDDSAVGRALARSRAALRAWGADDDTGGAMPPDVATRLDDVLAAAAAEGTGERGTVTTLPTLRSHATPNRNRWLAAAAAVVVIAGAGTAIGLASGGGSKKPAPTTIAVGAGAPNAPSTETITLPADVPVAVSENDFETDTAVAADVKSLITGKLASAPSAVAASVRAAASQAAAGQAAAEDSTAGAAVPAPVGAAGVAPSGKAATGPSPSFDAGIPLSDDLFGGEIAQCLQEIGQGQTLVGVERAAYRGKQALFLAFRDPSRLNRIDVFIVGRSCSASGGAGIQKYLTVDLS